MSEVTVSTKKELEKAVKDKVDTIIVTGELTKKVAILKKIYKLGRKKIIVLTSAISGACAAMISTAVIAASAAPSTGGASLIIAGFVEAGEAAAAATATGTSVAVIVALVSACAFLGSTLVQELLRLYDLTESHVKINKDGFEFHKKYSDRNSKND